MNENKTNQKNKKEKVGPDGLSKKERRAQKVAEKAKAGNEPKAENTQKDIPKKIVHEVKINVKANHEVTSDGTGLKVNAKANTTAKNDGIELKVNAKENIENKGDGSGLSKKERRALKVKAANVEKIVEKPVEKIVEKVTIEKKENQEGKSKAQLRAERREIQEKQRLAKLATKDAKPEVKKTDGKEPIAPSPTSTILSKKKIIKKEQGSNQVQLFNHLHFKPLKFNERCIVNNVHPSFLRLGAQYSSKTILGSNARCLALLASIKDIIDDFTTPPKQEFCRSLETYIQTSIEHLQKCRPFAVSMTNALRHFNVLLTKIETDISDDEKKMKLHSNIDTYVHDQIRTAAIAISMKVSEKISNGDVILTYGSSSLIKRILIDSKEKGKKFKVIIVDSRPLLEGREMLRKLVNAGIECTYTLINAASFIMSSTTKVLLGAHALLANGYVMARIGTAQIALVAQAYSKPVLVCCETYKFCERVQTDSFVYNEIDDPEKILNIDGSEEPSPLRNLTNSSSFKPLNLLYDVTPPDFVTAVVTELGFLPCTSVPVILRIKPTDYAVVSQH